MGTMTPTMTTKTRPHSVDASRRGHPQNPAERVHILILQSGHRKETPKQNAVAQHNSDRSSIAGNTRKDPAPHTGQIHTRDMSELGVAGNRIGMPLRSPAKVFPFALRSWCRVARSLQLHPCCS